MDDVRYIIVDGNFKIMKFAGSQLCYTYRNTETYTKEQAKEYIKKSINYRKKKGFGLSEYILIKVK